MAGVKGRSGRPRKLTKLQLESLLNDNWPLADRRAVIKSLHKQAIAGNVEAAKVLLFMAYGKPPARHEISGPEGRPLAVQVDPIEDLVEMLTRRAVEAEREDERKVEEEPSKLVN